MPFRLLSRLLLGALTSALSLQCAFASVVVHGGSDSQRQAIQRAYAGLPECCRTSATITVQLFDSQKMNRYLEDAEGPDAKSIRNDAIDGVYQDRIPTITLRVPSVDSDLSATFTHEYGHFVWYRILTEKQRKNYGAVYKNQAAAHCLVSRYATESTEEGFAEAYSFFVRNREYLEKCDPLSCHCLREWMSPVQMTSAVEGVALA